MIKATVFFSLNITHKRWLFSSVQSLSRVRLFVTPWTVACQASLSITNSRSLLNSCPSNQWCHPTISSSVVPFSTCLQSFPELGSFWMNQFFISGGQSTGASASASVFPMNIQNSFPLGANSYMFIGIKMFPSLFELFLSKISQKAYRPLYSKLFEARATMLFNILSLTLG